MDLRPQCLVVFVSAAILGRVVDPRIGRKRLQSTECFFSGTRDPCGANPMWDVRTRRQKQEGHRMVQVL